METSTVMTAFIPGNLQQTRCFSGLRYNVASRQPVDANAALWQREITKPPAGPGSTLYIPSTDFGDGPRTILLPIAVQGRDVCDDGSNTASSNRDYAVCSSRIGIGENGRVVAIHPGGQLCVEVVNAGGVQPALNGKHPTRLSTRVRYDATAHTIELVTLRQRGCGKTSVGR